MEETALSQLQNTPQIRPKGRSARILEAIKSATLELILNGEDALPTIDQIAEAAAVNKTTIYRRWESKQRLITWVLIETMKEEIPYPDTGRLREDLLSMAESFDRFLSTPLAATLLQIFPLASSERGAVGETIEEFWNERKAMIDEVIIRGVDRKEIRQDVDMELFVAQLFGPIYYSHLSRSNAITPKVIKDQVELVVSLYSA